MEVLPTPRTSTLRHSATLHQKPHNWHGHNHPCVEPVVCIRIYRPGRCSARLRLAPDFARGGRRSAVATVVVVTGKQLIQAEYRVRGCSDVYMAMSLSNCKSLFVTARISKGLEAKLVCSSKSQHIRVSLIMKRNCYRLFLTPQYFHHLNTVSAVSTTPVISITKLVVSPPVRPPFSFEDRLPTT